MQQNINPRLVQVCTKDGLYLHGYISPNNNHKTVILHIHGFEGNFYENNFVHVLINETDIEKIAFLTVNTRGNGKETEFNTTGGDTKRIGARYELLEESHLDISAWIKFLIDQGYTEIILQGHSLGTLKVVRYMIEGEYKDKIIKLILLAPFDKKGLIVASNRQPLDELLEKATQIIKSGKGEDIVTKEFGDIELSYNTYVSWYKQDDLGRIFEFCSPNYKSSILEKITIPVLTLVGSKDDFFYATDPNQKEVAMEWLLNQLGKGEGKIIQDAAHSFSPNESLMAKEVTSFIKKEK